MASTAASFLRKLKPLLVTTVGGISTVTLYSIYTNNEHAYRNYIMPTIHHVFQPETAHKLAVYANKYKLLPKSHFQDPENLKINVFGINFENPIGMAAGFDKNAVAIAGLHKLGFGFVEVGSVTPLPQEGNPKPRLFRLYEDQAIINRYGFNNDGLETVQSRLSKLKTVSKSDVIIGVNLGANKTSVERQQPINDYILGIEKLAPFADYLVINVSSPNTQGLRDLQAAATLETVLNAIVKTRDNCTVNHPPLLIKLAPDLGPYDLESIAVLIQRKDYRIDGIVISNTTVQRPETLLNREAKNEQGGLSGAPMKQLSTDMIATMYKLTNGQIPIIGVGGVTTGVDAYEKIKAGASLVQLYTALVYEGPPVVTRIKRELAELLQRDGYTSVQDAVGAAHRKPHKKT